MTARRVARRGGLLVQVGLLLAACGSSVPSPPPRMATPGGPGLDPPSPRPAARGEALGSTDDLSGVRLTDGEDSAREVAWRLLRAVLDGDRATLEALVDDPVGRTLPSIGPVDRDRGPVLDAVQRSPLRTGQEASIEATSLVHGSRVTVSTVSEYLGTPELPVGLHATDLVVRLPLTPLGTQVLHALLPGWLGEGVVVVRAGRERPIVAL